MAAQVLLLVLALCHWTAVSLGACPAVVPQCYCQRKFMWNRYVYCDDLKADKVPEFRESATVYTEVCEMSPQ